MDVGASINPAIDIGQIEGAFVQGFGWAMLEELVWGSEDGHAWLPPGHCMTRGPGTYKIPSFNDVPVELNVTLLPDVSWREREREVETETETETETGKKEGERDGEGCTVFARLCPSYRADDPLLEYVLTDDLSPLSLRCFLILTSYSTATRARCTRQRP